MVDKEATMIACTSFAFCGCTCLEYIFIMKIVHKAQQTREYK